MIYHEVYHGKAWLVVFLGQSRSLWIVNFPEPGRPCFAAGFLGSIIPGYFPPVHVRGDRCRRSMLGLKIRARLVRNAAMILVPTMARGQT